jgi:ferredoxin, 2Fe-2S
MSPNGVAQPLHARRGDAGSPKGSHAQISGSDVSSIDVGEPARPPSTTAQGVAVPRIIFVKPDGQQREIEAADGESVMQAAVNNLVDGVVGECGGDLSCATCHVFIDPEWYDALPEASDDEVDMLEATSEEPTKFSRLSCQIKCHGKLDGLVVHVPATQRL